MAQYPNSRDCILWVIIFDESTNNFVDVIAGVLQTACKYMPN